MVHLLPARTGRCREKKRTGKRRRHAGLRVPPHHQTPKPPAAHAESAPASPEAVVVTPAVALDPQPAVSARAVEAARLSPDGAGPAVLTPSAFGAHQLPRVLVIAVALGIGAYLLRGQRAPETLAPPPPPPPSAAAPKGPPPTPPRFAEELDVATFQKGNIHTHTAKSDGDSAPEVVYGWYKSHGYNFLAVTDHNTFTDPRRFAYLEKKGSFVLLSGEEITMMGAGHQVHVNGLCTRKAIGGKHFDTQGAALAWAVAEVKAQGGVSLVNHPNWDWALTEKDIPAARGASLLEVFSGHPFVRTDGDEARKSHEAIWDHALSHGEVLAGAAVDDSHIFKPTAKSKEDEPKARPGRAWVEVFADSPEREALCEALGKGRLYSSSGVKIERIKVTRETYAITVSERDRDAEVTFVGKDGRVLQKGRLGDDRAASYTLQGGEGYVRAKITRVDGAAGWTQPSWLAVDPAEPPGPPALIKPADLAPIKAPASAAPLLPER